MDNSTYIELFVEEGKEHIQILNDNLLKLEKNREDIESINEIFRAAHTLKGMAGTMGFQMITDIAHNMENLLDEIRNHKKEVTSSIIDVLLECADAMEELVQSVIETGAEGDMDVDELLSKLKNTENPSVVKSKNKYAEKAVDLDEYQLSIINAGINQGLTPYWIQVKLQSTCLLKAARAYVVFQALEEFGEIIKTMPQVQDIEEEKFEDTFGVLLLTNGSPEDMRQRLNFVSELDSVDIRNLGHSKEEGGEEESQNEKAPTPGQGDKTPADSKQSSQEKSHAHTRSIRVDTEKLDNLMNLVSELITIKNTLSDVADNSTESEMKEPMEYLARITNGLHNAVMKVRMVPVEMVFSRFPRVVRDLAKDTKKEISLNIVGSETEIDRTIIDEIGDPLIHLLRNAIDHGIEKPDERLRAGKSSKGQVGLSAYHDGNNVVIEVIDDGKGIDSDAIVESALKKGLLKDSDILTMKEEEIINLMFHPGFSTAKSVSNISGRGVGMDVVKTKVESLGGVIDVTTQLGFGSKFTIRLPLTLSIIQALLVSVYEEIYAIPLNSIQEIIDINLADIKVLKGQEVISYNEVLIPLIWLKRELDIRGGDEEEPQTITAVVMGKGEKRIALSIGELIGQQEIVIKPLGQYLSDIKIISGATILGSGDVALILDINHLV